MAHDKSEDAKLYYNTATYASPTWAEICNVMDLTLSLSQSEIDLTTRCGGGFKEYGNGLIDATIDFSMLFDTSDTTQTALRNAFFNKTNIEVLVLNGSSGTAGTQGLRATCIVTSFTRNEALGDALKVDISLRPAENDDAAPAWYTSA